MTCNCTLRRRAEDRGGKADGLAHGTTGPRGARLDSYRCPAGRPALSTPPSYSGMIAGSTDEP